jgi:hypothetical protein
MTTNQKIELQKHVGAKPDGFWGPKSIAACKRHLRALMPKDNPWPSSSQSALRAFYGDPDDNSVIVSVVAPGWLRLYDSEKVAKSISCHKLVADSLLRALKDAHSSHPHIVSRYFGCHVDRAMRGGTSPSTHAYGAAIDLDASTNRNRQSWPTSATMPIEVMEAFARAMHFQATRP